MSDPPLYRRAVLVDTSAFLAYASKWEEQHARARRIQARLMARRWTMITTRYVLAEVHALALQRRGSDFALKLIDEVEHSDTAAVLVSDDDWLVARAILRRYRDKDFSMTDALSFAVMERLGISVAFTFDRHFVQYGLQIADEQIA